MRAGPAVPQWVVPGLTSVHGSGVFLLPSSQFSSEARILALEIYGHTAGQIRIFVSAFVVYIKTGSIYTNVEIRFDLKSLKIHLLVILLISIFW